MNDDLKQQLSALVDGELDDQRARFLLRRLGADPALAASWSRWHLTRACLRRETAGALRTDFASAISQALADDRAPQRVAGGHLLRWGAGLAVAASVAVAVLLTVPLGPSPPPSAPAVAAAPLPAAQVAASALTERDLRPSLGGVTQAVATHSDARLLSPAVRMDPQMHGYLLRHSAALRDSGDASFLPFVPVVAPVRPWSMVQASASESASR